MKAAVEKLVGQGPLSGAPVLQLTGDGLLDGGDAMFDGRSLWVGLSHRTNQAAVDQLGELLAPFGIPVVGIAFSDPAASTLHLKVRKGRGGCGRKLPQWL